MGQYAAVQALGLLIRSHPDKWWRHISPIFADILVNPNHAAMTKASVISTYGKIAQSLRPESSYFATIQDLLWKLSDHPSTLVSRPATIALCDFSLVHAELFPRVLTALSSKVNPSNSGIANSPPDSLKNYLRTWCKMVSGDGHTTSNSRSRFSSDSSSMFPSSEQVRGP